jgi:antitoxin (DNA-binding transcriptional repressor) of toxin-antitoxin stability system
MATDEVSKPTEGDKVLITRRGIPVAMLVSPKGRDATDVAQVVRDMLAYRDQHRPRLGAGLTVRDLVQEGRRF